MNHPRRVALFMLCGGLAALANIGSRALFSLLLPYPAAIALAYGVGMAVAFVLFKTLVFEGGSGKGSSHEIPRFVLVNMLALLQTLAISIILADHVLPYAGWEWHRHDVAHIIGVLVPVITSYIGHKRYTFHKGPTCA